MDHQRWTEHDGLGTIVGSCGREGRHVSVMLILT